MARLDPTKVVLYDPTWPASFEVECVPLEQALRGLAAGPVEHIVSTAAIADPPS